MSTPHYPICPRCGLRPADQMTLDGLCCIACRDKQAIICDFCSATDPCWDYPTQSFATGDVLEVGDARYPTMSTGGWAACQTCHDYIEALNYSSLLQRSVHTFLQKYGPLPDNHAMVLLRNELHQLHQQFRRHR